MQQSIKFNWKKDAVVINQHNFPLPELRQWLLEQHMDLCKQHFVKSIWKNGKLERTYDYETILHTAKKEGLINAWLCKNFNLQKIHRAVKSCFVFIDHPTKLFQTNREHTFRTQGSACIVLIGISSSYGIPKADVLDLLGIVPAEYEEKLKIYKQAYAEPLSDDGFFKMIRTKTAMSVNHIRHSKQEYVQF